MKVLFIVTLLSFYFVANAKISDEVLKCRWETFGEDISVLYINMESPEMPEQNMIDNFCHKVNNYKTCVSSEKEEQITVELMEGMCEYGFKAVYNNITCLKTAVRIITAVCTPRRGSCESSYQWFQCSQIVTQNLCGDVLGFVMATLQPFYCQISEAFQVQDLLVYEVGKNSPSADPLSTQNNEVSSKRITQGKNKITIVDSEPTSTKGPTQTAKPTPTKGPTQTAKPTPTKGPTQTAKPTSTKGPTQTAKPTPTKGPTKTAKPTPTKGPTQTAKPTSTKGPTQTAKPTPTKGPTKTAKPTPTKGPSTTVKSESTTNSGINNLPSCVSYAVSIVVAAHMMKGF